MNNNENKTLFKWIKINLKYTHKTFANLRSKLKDLLQLSQTLVKPLKRSKLSSLRNEISALQCNLQINYKNNKKTKNLKPLSHIKITNENYSQFI